MSDKIIVHTQAELMTALASARGGEVIHLAGGAYGDVSINGHTGGYRYSENVTLTALRSDDSPVFSGLNMRLAENLTFSGIIFDYVYENAQPIWHNPFRVTDSVGVRFDGCVFDGDVARGLNVVDDGFATGRGLQIVNSKGVTVVDCEFASFYRGLIVGNSDDVLIRGNDVHSIRSDGMNFYAVQDIVVEANHIHDFRRSIASDDHADMIQFWTANTTRPSIGIIIRDNILDVGQGDPAQSLHMRNELYDLGLAGDEIRYQDILIENNIIMNGHRHGINVGEVDGLRIQGNTVVHAQGSNAQAETGAVTVPVINVASSSTAVTITANVTAAITGQSVATDWVIRDNAFVQNHDPLAPGWYEDVFVRSTLGADHESHRYIVLPDGMIDRLGAGATGSYMAHNDSLPTAMFHVDQVTEGHSQVTFDARMIVGAQPEGARYLWMFGDGTMAEGPLVSHDYKAWGHFDATLVVQWPDGQVSKEQHSVTVNNPSLVRFDGAGFFTVSQAGSEVTLPHGVTAATEASILLGNSGVAASVGRSVLVPMLQSETVKISFEITANSVGLGGEIFRLHQSIIVDVTTKGEFRVQAWSNEGTAAGLVAKGLTVTDGDSYKVDVDLHDGQLFLSVNGQLMAQDVFDGTFANIGRHDLMFGTPWNTRHFSGEMTSFEISLGDPLPEKNTSGITVIEPDKWDLINGLENADTVDGVATDPHTDDFDHSNKIPDNISIAPPVELVRLLEDGTLVSGLEGKVLNVARYVDDDGGMQLGEAGITASVARSDLAPLFATDNLLISFSLDADQAGASGEVFRLHNSLYAFVKSNGELLIQAWTAAGDEVSLLSKGVLVNDGATYDIDIRLENGNLSLSIDDKLLSDSSFDGTFADAGKHDLMFGNPWNSRHFNGDLSEFVISYADMHRHDPFATNSFSMDTPLV